MRIISIATALLFAILMPLHVGHAQTQYQTPEQCLGKYGCFHLELHELKIIDDMRARIQEKMNTDSLPGCCDNMGECRLTIIRNGRVLLDGTMCRIPVSNLSQMVGIRLPVQWMQYVVVCAGQPAGKGVCPSIYCMGAASGL